MKTGLANTITQLCAAVPMSRTWFYELRRQPGAPVPRANGKFSISEWRRFSKKKQATCAKQPSEKSDLELRCLKLKAERLEYELDEARAAKEGEYMEKWTIALRALLQILRKELDHRFSRMAAHYGDRELYRRLRDGWNEAIQIAGQEYKKKTGISPVAEKEGTQNVIQYERKAAVAWRLNRLIRSQPQLQIAFQSL